MLSEYSLLSVPLNEHCESVIYSFEFKSRAWLIGYMIRTPQVLGSRLGGYGTLSTELLTDHHHNSIIKLSVHWCVWKVRSDIQIGSSIFQCDVPHQWITQRQVVPVSVYCDGVGCHVLCVWHGIPVWQHIGQSTNVTSRHCRNMTTDVKVKLNPNKTNR